jgi:hypothetical protein
MIAALNSATFIGIDAVLVNVEVLYLTALPAL